MPPRTPLTFTLGEPLRGHITHFRSIVAALAIGVVVLVGCGGVNHANPVLDRAPSAQATSETVVAVEGEPRQISFARPGGDAYFASEVFPEPVYRDGLDGAELNPDTELPVRWAEAGLPSTDTRETVVIVGHNYTDRIAPFYHLREVAEGDTVALALADNVLTYRVEEVTSLAKGALLTDHELRRHKPGRLILANCDVIDGTDTGDNYLVIAQLEN
ncbi:class F sortase [Hoyosella rhizosphaerae]|uniref:class F sortase n=1 Tax=Hoyosella rhizosphaerae TaxID=1755582 RepID=UPI00166BD055|nr:class F sortase [Hoyosella rhizosphaerae]MBN4926795.1 class F sortase [Hoyosella rhizosphaerae]